MRIGTGVSMGTGSGASERGRIMKYNERALRLEHDLNEKCPALQWKVLLLDDVRFEGRKESNLYAMGTVDMAGEKKHWGVSWPIELLEEAWDGFVYVTVDGAMWALERLRKRCQ